MKELLTPKNILILALSIYAITAIERMFSNDYHESEVKDRYMEEKRQMQEVINNLQLQNKYYEIKLDQVDNTVNTYSNSQLDSVFAAFTE